MSNTRLNPPSLYESTGFGFSHATVQDGGRTIHLAGQVAWDKDCNVVGPGDLAAQTRQALANLKAVLEAAGATPADVVRLRTISSITAPTSWAWCCPRSVHSTMGACLHPTR